MRLRILLIALGGWSAAASAQPACTSQFVDGSAPKITSMSLLNKLRELCIGKYAVGHSGVYRVPLWSAEHFTKASAQAAIDTAGEEYSFTAEPQLAGHPEERAELSDYRKSGYDRGHMTPSGDFAQAQDDKATFTLANVVPQHPCLNQRTWRKMEEIVLKGAATRAHTYVITGPLYEGSSFAALKGRVFVPTSTFKAIYIPAVGAAAYVATNPVSRTEPPKWQVISIAELAQRAGIDPFPTLSATIKGTAISLALPAEPASACKKGN